MGRRLYHLGEGEGDSKKSQRPNWESIAEENVGGFRDEQVLHQTCKTVGEKGNGGGAAEHGEKKTHIGEEDHKVGGLTKFKTARTLRLVRGEGNQFLLLNGGGNDKKR